MKSQTILLILSISLCVSSTRMLTKEGISIDYSVNCKNFDKQTGTCMECFEGCTKWENICVKIVKHCAGWDQKGNCVECEKGYGDESNKSVDGACPKQTAAPSNTGGQETTVSSNQGTGTIP